MANSHVEELQNLLAEVNKLMGIAEQKRIKDILSIEARRIETELLDLREADKKGTEPSQSVQKPASKPRVYDVTVKNYAWDQSDKFVKIFVTLPKVHTINDKVSCEFTNRSFNMVAQELENRNHHLHIANLLEEIDSEKSFVKVKTDTVVVFLAKAKLGIHWSSITSTEKKATEPKAPKMKNPSDDPFSGLMGMMKQIYDDGDDEIKRTIAKAWTEMREKQNVS